MLRGSQAQQLTGKGKGKVQEDDKTTKVSRVDRLPKTANRSDTDKSFTYCVLLLYNSRRRVHCFWSGFRTQEKSRHL